MLAYCVNHLSSLKARFVSEHFGKNKSKIKKGGHITELRQTTHLSQTRKLVDQDLPQDSGQDTYVCCYLGFALLYSVVIVS